MVHCNPVLFFWLFFMCANASKRYFLNFDTGERGMAPCEDAVPKKYHYLYTDKYCEIVANRIANLIKSGSKRIKARETECTRAPAVSCWCRRTCATCEGFDIIDSNMLNCTLLASHSRPLPNGGRITGCQIYPTLRTYCPDACDSGDDVTCDGMGVPEPY